MRILIVSPSVYPVAGGMQRFTHNLAHSLALAGQSVTLYSLEAGPQSILRTYTLHQPLPRFAGWPSGLGTLLRQIHYIYNLARLVINFRPQRIISTWWAPLGLWAGLVAAFGRVSFWQVFHAMELFDASPSSAIRKAVRFFLLRLATRCVAVSHFTAARLAALGVPLAKIRVIPNGLLPEWVDAAARVEPAAARQSLGLSGPAILIVGRLVARKGHAILLAALTEIQGDSHPPLTCFIVGDGPQRPQLESIAATLPPHIHAVFTGEVSEAQLHQYYAAADVIALPAFDAGNSGDVEGFGIVFLEAYAHAKPVVGTLSGGIPDAVHTGQTGLLVPPGAVTPLATALTSLLTDPVRAGTMGQAGRQQLAATWNWAVLAQAYLEQDQRLETHTP